jgi:Na+-driven multidrug efflux pump
VDIPIWWWILQLMVDTLTVHIYLDVFMLNLWILPAGGGFYYSSWCCTISAGTVYFLLVVYISSSWCLFPAVVIFPDGGGYSQMEAESLSSIFPAGGVCSR